MKVVQNKGPDKVPHEEFRRDVSETTSAVTMIKVTVYNGYAITGLLQQMKTEKTSTVLN